MLTPDGVKKTGPYTVEFHLAAPNGNFPYLTSSDNYNMIILPKDYDPSKWQSSFVGTGPFVMKSYTTNRGATFTANPSYWGPKPKPPARTSPSTPPRPRRSAPWSAARSTSSGSSRSPAASSCCPAAYNIIKLKSSAHRELSMRNDVAPFTDARVRQAIALTLNRPQIVQALFKGFADLGNDSPFAPVFPSTDTSVPQRAQDIAKAKSLLSAAGHPNGFSTQLIANEQLEIPQYATIVQQSAKAIGVNINVNVESPTMYYGKATFGNSDWLDATMSLVDYGHRSVPNVFLTAPLQTINAKAGTGSWNAAHFNNAQYDTLSKQYIAAVDLSTQQQHRRPDRDAAAERDADHLRLLLQLPDRAGEERDRRLPHGDRAHLPVQHRQGLPGTVQPPPGPWRSRGRLAAAADGGCGSSGWRADA